MKVHTIQKIAKGTFGIIELVKDGEGNKFARKMLLSQRRRDKVHQLGRQRFLDEILFMESVKHSLLTPLIYAENASNQPWFLMPLATSDLKHDIQNLPTNKHWAKKALSDILDGLQFIHDKGYYHRDLCCSNILRFDTEDGPIYKLCDFGCITKNTSTGPFHKIDSGHKRYAPPEITKRPAIGSPRSDIYGFGAILHEIFGQKERISRECITAEDGPLSHIMERCTKLNPEDRYQDISELRGDMDKAIT